VTLQKLKDLNLPIETIIAGHYDPNQGADQIDRYLAQLSVFTQPPYSIADNLFDLTRPDDLGLKPAPGAKTFTIFEAKADTPHFANGVVLMGFKGKLYAQWQSSPQNEDEPGTHVVYAVSEDGRHWSGLHELTKPGKVMTSSGGWWSNGKELIAYINVWPDGFNREAGGYVEYLTSRDGLHWSKPQRITSPDGKPFLGVIEQDLHTLPDGRIVTAFHIPPGLTAAPYYTDDPKGLSGWTRGEMHNLPHEGLESREMEPAWFRRADSCLTMVFRDQANSFRQLASLSCDRGEHWSAPALTAMPDARQKQSAGDLPDGTAFLVHAPSGNTLRSPLVLTLSKDGKSFDRAFVLRAGPPPPPKWPGTYKKAGYHYPKSVWWNGGLWVGYADAKENVVVTYVPVKCSPDTGANSPHKDNLAGRVKAPLGLLKQR